MKTRELENTHQPNSPEFKKGQLPGSGEKGRTDCPKCGKAREEGTLTKHLRRNLVGLQQITKCRVWANIKVQQPRTLPTQGELTLTLRLFQGPSLYTQKTWGRAYVSGTCMTTTAGKAKVLPSFPNPSLLQNKVFKLLGEEHQTC